MVTVYFSNETGNDMSEYERLLETIINESLKAAAPGGGDAEVGVTFTDNSVIRALNNRYRHIDSETDVLSFPMYGSWREWPVTGPAAVIGDVVISVERAAEQSETYGHSLARELGFLTAHSMLHLMGYDHMNPESEAEMFALQDKILMGVGMPR